jgi:peptidoglycan-N-acetylglucosamine deacetylase
MSQRMPAKHAIAPKHAKTQPSKLSRVKDSWSLRRFIIVFSVGGLLLVAGRVDRVAAGLALVAMLTTMRVLRIRTHATARRAGLVAGAGATILGIVAALALPVFALKTDPLIVNLPSEAAPASPPSQQVLADVKQQAGATVLGFAATDYDDTAGGLDGAARNLTVVAATGITLGSTPGTIVSALTQDSMVRAHIAGAHAYAVVSNFDGTSFEPKSVEALLSGSGTQDLFIRAVNETLAKGNWDGVVIDFESLSPKVRSRLPKLISSLRAALRNKQVYVTVPAFSDPEDTDSLAYDLEELAAASSGIILTAYDQHDPSTDPGPIASLAWVSQAVKDTLKLVPADKLMLGIPSFGYVWPQRGASPIDAEEITAKQGAELVNILGSPLRYDPVSGERHGTMADGGEAWFVDGQGTRARAAIARENNLKGVALWRIGAEENGTVASLPFRAEKAAPVAPNRPMVTSQKTGVVSLTFDDGPDPKYTKAVLDILEKKHVPATFFVVAKLAEKHPDLISRMVRQHNVVANHSYSHLDTAKASQWRNELDIVSANGVIEGITGRTPLLFRAPYGGGDSTKNHKGSDAIAESLGMHPVGWNVDSNDWKKPGANAIVSTVVSQASEHSVVLMHDGGGDRTQTLAALPRIIDQLQAKGYLFTTIDGIDASLSSSYRLRTSVASRARGLAIIAFYRLQLSVRKLFLWVVVATALVAFLRVLMAAPLALGHVLNTRRRRKRLVGLNVPEPTVTILVPAYNEAKVIANTLRAIARCMPAPLEVLVLDDGSTDETTSNARRAIKELQEQFPHGCSMRLITLPNGGKANALNYGTSIAQGDVVLVIDADTIVDANIIGHMSVHFRDPRVGAVAGNVKVGNRRNVLAALQTLEYVIALNLDRRAQDIAHVMAVVPGAAGAFRTSVLLELGGYPTDTLVEDADLTQIMLREGWRIHYEPLAVAWTEAPQSVSDVVKQRRRWSYGTIQVVNKHKRAVFEPKAGALGLIGLPWMLITQVVLPVFGPLADVYLLYLLLIGARSQAIGILLLAFVSDLILAALAVAIDREKPSIVLLAPLLRVVWRPLQLWIVASSTRRFARGEDVAWRKITRHNSVGMRRSSQVSTVNS